MLILKSYDGGKNWERGRAYGDFAAAAAAAQTLRAACPYLRVRLEMVAPEEAARPARRRRN